MSRHPPSSEGGGDSREPPGHDRPSARADGTSGEAGVLPYKEISSGPSETLPSTALSGAPAGLPGEASGGAVVYTKEKQPWWKSHPQKTWKKKTAQ